MRTIGTGGQKTTWRPEGEGSLGVASYSNGSLGIASYNSGSLGIASYSKESLGVARDHWR